MSKAYHNKTKQTITPQDSPVRGFHYILTKIQVKRNTQDSKIH
jgi:hypothetical protein